MMSLTLGIYWVDLGFINNYKEPQLWLVFLRYSADVAIALPWVVTTAPSKFAFNSLVAGGFHLAGGCFSFGPRLGNFHWNSVNIAIAASKTLLIGLDCSLHLILFLRHQTDQATIANTSSLAKTDRTTPTRLEIVFSWFVWLWSQVKLGSQMGWIVSQLHMAWGMSSEAFWQKLQTTSSITLLFGKASIHARQRKILTLFDTLSCHIFCNVPKS